MRETPLGGSVQTPVLATVAAAILWGTSFVTIKAGLDYIDAYQFAFLRLLTAFLFALVLVAASERLRTNLLRDKLIWALGLLNAAGFILQYVGLVYTTASKTSLLVNLNVVTVAILSWRMYGERFGWRKELGILLAVAGVFLLTTRGDARALVGGESLGDLLVLLAGTVWAFFIVVNKKVVSTSRGTLTQVALWVMLVTVLGLGPFTLISGSFPLRSVTWQGWAAAVYTGIFCTTVPFLLWSKALRVMSATVSSLILLLEVVVALITSNILLGETFTLEGAIGAALVLGSIFTVSSQEA